MGVAGSIFEPHPPNFGKSDIFWRFTNDITIIFGNFHHCKSFKKYTQAIRPGVEESLICVVKTKIHFRSLNYKLYNFDCGHPIVYIEEWKKENSYTELEQINTGSNPSTFHRKCQLSLQIFKSCVVVSKSCNNASTKGIDSGTKGW